MQDESQTKKPKVRTRVTLDADVYRAVRHAAVDLGPTFDVGEVVALAVSEYLERQLGGTASG